MCKVQAHNSVTFRHLLDELGRSGLSTKPQQITSKVSNFVGQMGPWSSPVLPRLPRMRR